MSIVNLIIFLVGFVIGVLLVLLICKCKKKMKIIFLTGASKTGKTPTLLKVYNNLFNKKEPKYYKKIKHENRDLTDIECFPLKQHCKKIALCTAGDYWDYIKEAVKKFNCMRADLLIIAFNDEIIKREKAEEFIQPHFFIDKKIIDNSITNDDDKKKEEERLNEKDCQEIIDLIKIINTTA